LEADEILADLNSQLTSDQTQLLDLLLENETQREIAERLKVDERTVRRRIAAIRAVVAGHLADDEYQEPSLDSDSVSISLPKITYREFVLGKMDGRIVITDFGFSTHLHPPTKVSDPQLSLAPLGGTLGFAAPEQVSPAFGQISPATDIYAIGGLAHFLLTGLGPHDSKVSSLMDTVSDDDVAVVKSPSNAAESKLASVANLALKKAINRRPSSVRELAALLLD